MTEKSSSELPAFSEPAIRSLIKSLRNYLGARYHFVADHEDLVQQTLADLYGAASAKQDGFAEQDQITPLAFTILKRRIADRFRIEAKEFAWAMLAENEQVAPSTEVVAMYRQRLALTMAFIAELPAADRMLLLHSSQDGDSFAMPATDRKRLSRLRIQLRDLLERKALSSGKTRGGNDG